MPFVKGQAKIGGRKKGSISKTLSVREILEKNNFDVIEKMIELYETVEDGLKTKLLAELASYAHPKLRSHEHSGVNGGPISLEVLIVGSHDKP